MTDTYTPPKVWTWNKENGGKFASTIDYHEKRDFAVPKIRRAMKRGTKETS